MKWLKTFAHGALGAFATGFVGHLAGANAKTILLSGLVGGITAVFSLWTEKPQ